MERSTVVLPSRRIGATEQEHNVLNDLQEQVVAADFKRENHDIGIIEEIQVDMHNVEDDRLRARSREKPHLGDVFAPVDANGRLSILRPATTYRALPVENPLDVFRMSSRPALC